MIVIQSIIVQLVVRELVSKKTWEKCEMSQNSFSTQLLTGNHVRSDLLS